MNESAPRILMKTSMGDIVLELNAEKAPITVKNFIQYVEDGHYNGTIFHRVIPNFMVQGGGFTKDMVQKETRETIQNEANNGLANTVGTIAMARTAVPHSASSQFFINVNDNDFLNFSSETQQGWGYAVFGEVVEGLDVVMKIVSVPTGNHGGHGDVPLSPIVIEEASVVSE